MIRWLAGIVLLGTNWVSVWAAPLVFTEGHADIGVRYVGGKLEIGVNFLGAIVDGAPLTQFVPLNEVTVFVPESTLEARPSNISGLLDFNPIGVPAGADVYRLPPTGTEAFILESPYLGFGTYLLSAAEFVGPVTFRLTSFWSEKGGEFALYQDSFPGPTFLVTTANGVGPEDQFTLGAGAHDHYNWAFTKDGLYRLGWSAEVQHRTLGKLLAQGVMGTGVTTTVPESSGVLLGGIVLAGLAVLVRSRSLRSDG